MNLSRKSNLIGLNFIIINISCMHLKILMRVRGTEETTFGALEFFLIDLERVYV